MKLIIPMAGKGSRLRPHTLTTPKPLIPIAGKAIVQRLVEEISVFMDKKVEEVHFIISREMEDSVEMLKKIGIDIGAKSFIHYQDIALGTAHAIFCAKEALKGEIIIAFADTLFKGSFKGEYNNVDGYVWVKEVDNPSAFGVVKLNERGEIIDFIEKPKNKISNLAIIGIYYFKKGEDLKNEIQYIIENNILEYGEYQLTKALQNMKLKGKVFLPTKIHSWMDCGNKDAVVSTNKDILSYAQGKETLISKKILLENSVIIHPCYIDEGVQIKNSKIGPYVSIGSNTKIENTNIENSLILNEVEISNSNLTNSMIGNNAIFKGHIRSVSMGDYTILE